MAGLYIQLQRSHTSAILASVTHFLHQQLQLVEAVEGRAILILVITKRFAEPNHSDPAFVFDLLAHLEGYPKFRAKLGINFYSYRSPTIPVALPTALVAKAFSCKYN